MDLALGTYDILVSIFAQLDTSLPRDRQTLARCARTWRSFYEPSSAVLWRDLYSFDPLWSLLHDGVLRSRIADRAAALTEIVTTGRCEDPMLWATLRRYASRVRGIRLPFPIVLGVHAGSEIRLITELVRLNGGQTFLPSLTRLSWAYGTLEPDAILLRIITPALRELEITIDRPRGRLEPLAEDRHHIDRLLEQLPLSVPTLRDLTISGNTPRGPSLVPHLYKFTTLRDLSLNAPRFAPDPSELQAILAHLPHLQVLTTNITSAPASKPITATAPALLVLHLGNSLATLEPFFAHTHLDAPHLHTLSLLVHDCALAPDHGRRFASIAAAPFAHALRSLTFTVAGAGSWLSEPAPSTPLLALLGPFLALGALETVRFRAPLNVVSAADADVQTVARAWPRAEELELRFAPDPAHAPSLGALAHFAEGCPALHTLALTFVKLDFSPKPPMESAGAHPLRTLDVVPTFCLEAVEWDCRKHAQMNAAALDALFPEAELYSEAQIVPRGWKDVCTSLRERRERRDGRRVV